MEKRMIYYIAYAFFILSTTLTLHTVSSLIMFEAETLVGVCFYATMIFVAYDVFIVWTGTLLSRESDLRNWLNNPWVKGLMEVFFSLTSNALVSGSTIIIDFLDQSFKSRPMQRHLLNGFLFSLFNGMVLVVFWVGVCIRTGYEKYIVLFLVIQCFNYVTKVIEGSTMYWRANSICIGIGGACLLHIALYNIYYHVEEVARVGRQRTRRARRRQARRDREQP